MFVKISAIIAYWTGAPERIGFNTDGQRRGWLYTKRVVYTDSQHMSGIFGRLLLPLGLWVERGRAARLIGPALLFVVACAPTLSQPSPPTLHWPL